MSEIKTLPGTEALHSHQSLDDPFTFTAQDGYRDLLQKELHENVRGADYESNLQHQPATYSNKDHLTATDNRSPINPPLQPAATGHSSTAVGPSQPPGAAATDWRSDGKASLESVLWSFGKGLIEPLTAAFGSPTRAAVTLGVVGLGLGLSLAFPLTVAPIIGAVAYWGGLAAIVGGVTYGGAKSIYHGYQAYDTGNLDHLESAAEGLGTVAASLAPTGITKLARSQRLATAASGITTGATRASAITGSAAEATLAAASNTATAAANTAVAAGRATARATVNAATAAASTTVAAGRATTTAAVHTATAAAKTAAAAGRATAHAVEPVARGASQVGTGVARGAVGGVRGAIRNMISEYRQGAANPWGFRPKS